ALVSGNAAAGALEWGPGWNGYWYDPATGLWLSRNRWFDPVGGRWITRDPAGYVDGLSLYLYVRGNPFLFRDPSGLYTWGEWGQIGAAFVTGGAEGYVDLHAATGRLVKNAAVEGANLAADVAQTGYALATNDQDMLAAPSHSSTMEGQSRGTFAENATGNLANAVAAPVVAPYEASKEFISAGINSYETGDPMGDATVGFVTTTLPAVGGATVLAESGMQFAKSSFKRLISAETSTLGDAAGGMCFVAGTTVWTSSGPVPIEQVEIGHRVLGMSENTVDDTSIAPEEWRCFEVEVVGAPERNGTLKLLRPAAWATDNRIDDERPGHWIRLSIPEWQLSGRAKVIAVASCPEIRPGPGRLVLMKSKTRYTGDFAELHLVGSAEALCGTWTHPIFSANRNCFVSLGTLITGEQVRTADGRALVESVTRSRQSQEVFNLEVDRDHQFYVGELKVVSHNAGGCARKPTGSYTNEHASGNSYSGKGSVDRMNKSARRIEKLHNDPVVSQEHAIAPDAKQAFIAEQKRIELNGGPGGTTYNKINSPGKKLGTQCNAN
ncbi:MAG: RHS repeat-associated core domain-containing protein, partial [Phycisphaerales bacterium]